MDGSNPVAILYPMTCLSPLAASSRVFRVVNPVGTLKSAAAP